MVGAIVLVACAHAAIATGATLRFDDAPESFVQEQAEAFLAGQIHLKQLPSAELLSLDDPYDADKNHDLRKPDAILFNGKYYWYWGPVPSLLHAGWILVAGTNPSASASFLAYVTGSALLFLYAADRLRRALCPSVSPRWTVIGFVAFALGGTNPLLLSRLIMHQGVIAADGFFVLAAACSLINAFTPRRRGVLMLVLAGTFLGLGVATRITLLGYCAAAIAVTLARWAVLRTRRSLLDTVAIGVPILLSCAGLLWYNYVRFASPLDFGMTMQLTGIKGNTNSASLAYLPYHFGMYLLSRPRLSPFFPFVTRGWDQPFSSFPGQSLDSTYISAFVLAPLLILSPLAILQFRSLRCVAQGPAAALAVLGLGAIATLGGLMMFEWDAVRYLHDMVPAASLLGIVGLYWLVKKLETSALNNGIYAFLAGSLVFVGTLVGCIAALPELHTGHQEMYFRLAFLSDRIETRFMKIIAPEQWTQAYLGPEVRQRTGGAFYPAGAMISFDSYTDKSEYEFTAFSLLSRTIDVQIIVNDRQVTPVQIRPGSQRVSFTAQSDNSQPTSEVRIQFADESSRKTGDLWPITITPVTPSR